MAVYHKDNVTYHAPEGDSKVVEMAMFPGISFFDGVATDVIVTLDQHLTLENNKHFQINSSVEHDPGDQPAAATAPGAPAHQPADGKPGSKPDPKPETHKR